MSLLPVICLSYHDCMLWLYSAVMCYFFFHTQMAALRMILE